MENESDALPPIHINDLVAQLLESKVQAERGEGRPANEILAEMETASKNASLPPQSRNPNRIIPPANAHAKVDVLLPTRHASRYK